MNYVLPYASLLLVSLLLVIEKIQNRKTVERLIDRLMIKAGFEPISDEAHREEHKTMVKPVMSKEELLARIGAVRLRNPAAELIPTGKGK